MPVFDVAFYPDYTICIAVSRVKKIQGSELWSALNGEIFSDDRWMPDMKALFDCRTMERIETGFERLYNVAGNMSGELETRLGKGKKAILCSTDQVFGICRQWKAVRNADSLILVTRELSEALEWLNIDDAAKYGIG